MLSLTMKHKNSCQCVNDWIFWHRGSFNLSTNNWLKLWNVCVNISSNSHNITNQMPKNRNNKTFSWKIKYFSLEEFPNVILAHFYLEPKLIFREVIPIIILLVTNHMKYSISTILHLWTQFHNLFSTNK